MTETNTKSGFRISFLLVGSFALLAGAEQPNDETLESPSRVELRDRILLTVVETVDPTPELLAEIASVWDEGHPVLEAVVFSLAKAIPEVGRLLEDLHADSVDPVHLPTILTDEAGGPFVRANLSLYVGRELVRKRLLEEGLGILEGISIEQVVDPATLYFHLAVCRYGLQQRQQALEALEEIENISGVPRRYQVLADQMRSMLEPLKRESLDGIAHDMRDLHRRLDLGRTNQKVRDLEKDILDRLDKMIERIEDQQNESTGQGGSQSSSPASESKLLGGKGPGKVGARTFKNKDRWGNLPEKEREKALQEIGREFPAHYRDAIEEYFRRLAGSK